jgi:response regulator RpfG family c-di-GMP phosphodiesterase
MMERILCVDDEPNILDAYQRSLRKDFQIDIAISGEQGLELIESSGPYAVIVSDMRMPGMDGVQFLTNARTLAPETVRIMLTGNADQRTASEAVNEGHIFRFLTKPCPPESLRTSLLAGIRQYHVVRAEKELLEKTLIGSLQLVTDILSMVNPTAFGRASRVRRLVRQLATIMKTEDAWAVEIAAMLSQIGFVTVPEDTLAKVYEGKSLTIDELRMVENSPKVGHDLISRIPRLEPVADIIAHQEALSRQRNPTAESGSVTKVPLGARILSLALDFDQLIESRLSSTQAFAEIHRRGILYYQPAVAALRQVVDASETMYEMREVNVSELAEHTILAEDIVAANGVLLVAKGQEVTESLRARLENFLLRRHIHYSVKVFVPIETPEYRRDTEVLPLVTAVQGTQASLPTGLDAAAP